MARDCRYTNQPSGIALAMLYASKSKPKPKTTCLLLDLLRSETIDSSSKQRCWRASARPLEPRILGFEVSVIQGLGFRVWGIRFRVWCLGVWGLGFGVTRSSLVGAVGLRADSRSLRWVQGLAEDSNPVSSSKPYALNPNFQSQCSTLGPARLRQTPTFSDLQKVQSTTRVHQGNIWVL